jgi:hypothetical protein
MTPIIPSLLLIDMIKDYFDEGVTGKAGNALRASRSGNPLLRKELGNLYNGQPSAKAGTGCY